MKKLVTMLTVGMIVAMTGCSTQEGAKPKTEQEPVKEVVVKEPEFDWSDSELVKDVPLPETDSTSIEEDRDDLFWVYINGDKDTFKAYVEKCVANGFDQDYSKGDTYFSGKNKNGDYIHLSYGGVKTMHVNIMSAEILSE